MKKTIVTFGILTAMLTTGPSFHPSEAQASSDRERPRWERSEGRDDSKNRHFARMARELDLSAAQQEQITAILAEHRTTVAPLRQNLKEGRTQMRQAVTAAEFDEAAVRSQAAAQVPVKTDLMVERARMMNQVHGVLTPEQQRIAEEKLSEWKRDGKSSRGERSGKRGR